jgi:hypothetical protein
MEVDNNTDITSVLAVHVLEVYHIIAVLFIET